jgi:hypothetical protein
MFAYYVVWQLVVLDEHDAILGWFHKVGGRYDNTRTIRTSRRDDLWRLGRCPTRPGTLSYRPSRAGPGWTDTLSRCFASCLTILSDYEMGSPSSELIVRSRQSELTAPRAAARRSSTHRHKRENSSRSVFSLLLARKYATSPRSGSPCAFSLNYRGAGPSISRIAWGSTIGDPAASPTSASAREVMAGYPPPSLW